MNQTVRRLLALVLVLALLPAVPALAADRKAELNDQTLYPQITGYVELDKEIAKILEGTEDSDTYTKIKTAYDWCVTQIQYSLEPYAKGINEYSGFSVEVPMTYTNGLQQSVPHDVAVRAYYAVTEKKGASFEYAALFVMMARAVGIDAYLHTGTYWGEGVEPEDRNWGWAELVLDGKYYIFDPYTDHIDSGLGTHPIPYSGFGIAYEDAVSYHPDTEANAARDAQFLSVASHRKHYVNVTVTATPSGSVTGGGSYDIGEQVTVTAASGTKDFVGWYDAEARLVSTDTVYTFTAEAPVTLKAVFSGEFFVDISEKDWFYEDASYAGENGIVSGVEPFVFSANTRLTRAMAVAILARAVGAETDNSVSPFADVPAGKWYTGPIAWAKGNRVVSGITETTFGPNDLVTREQYITILMRYAEAQGCTVEGVGLKYTDIDDISNYAVGYLEVAEAAKLLAGYSDGSLRPQGKLTRAEGVALLMRTMRWMESLSADVTE